MIYQVNNPNTSHAVSSNVDLDLLTALLEPEDAAYPWNPADEESEAYFYQLEQQCNFADFLDQELTTRSNNFYNHLDAIWSAIPEPKTDHNQLQTVNHLQQSLHQVFASLIPSGWLNSIATQAAKLFPSELPTRESLVSCVQSLFPDWQTEDLMVLTRDYALSMRSITGDSLPPIIDSLHERTWSNLSEIEQAKVSLAIANYAFQVLQEIQTEV